MLISGSSYNKFQLIAISLDHIFQFLCVSNSLSSQCRDWTLLSSSEEFFFFFPFWTETPNSFSYDVQYTKSLLNSFKLHCCFSLGSLESAPYVYNSRVIQGFGQTIYAHFETFFIALTFMRCPFSLFSCCNSAELEVMTLQAGKTYVPFLDSFCPILDGQKSALRQKA